MSCVSEDLCNATRLRFHGLVLMRASVDHTRADGGRGQRNWSARTRVTRVREREQVRICSLCPHSLQPLPVLCMPGPSLAPPARLPSTPQFQRGEQVAPQAPTAPGQQLPGTAVTCACCEGRALQAAWRGVCTAGGAHGILQRAGRTPHATPLHAPPLHTAAVATAPRAHHQHHMPCWGRLRGCGGTVTGEGRAGGCSHPPAPMV
jgi:hypothetical protein